jgi:crotonobetainyl-CoA:carnitine CoA-transferase CaiB-like acyl-CoA transferase
VLNTPFQISGADCEAQAYVSGVGEDTREILAELGYGPAELDELQSQKVFG